MLTVGTQVEFLHYGRPICGTVVEAQSSYYYRVRYVDRSGRERTSLMREGMIVAKEEVPQQIAVGSKVRFRYYRERVVGTVEHLGPGLIGVRSTSPGGIDRLIWRPKEELEVVG